MAKILVVDDSSIMRRNLSTILIDAGHTIVGEASNGESAYKEYERLLPDLVTMDITMPILDGIGAVKKIMKYHPETNIIMISALDQKQMVLAAVQNGAKHYIIKPFTSEKVIKVVNEVISNAEAADKTSATLNNKLDDAINELNTAIDDLDTVIENLEDKKPAERPKSESNSSPFTIESKVNQLKITLASSIQAENFQALNMIVQGFLYMKSLTVTLDLGYSKHFKEDIIKKLLELCRLIKGHGANIDIVAENSEVLEFVKAKSPFFDSIIK